MSKKINNKKHTGTMVKEFLNKTGFPFEMKMAKVFQSKNWKVQTNKFFLDLEEGKEREIDIIAHKKINTISVNLIVECKFSQTDSWVFSTKRRMSRYHNYLKEYPAIPSSLNDKIDSLNKCVGHLSVLKHDEPVGVNFIAFNGKNKSNVEPIRDALYKVIKATIHRAAKTMSPKPNHRSLYFPVVLFSSHIFSFNYARSLSVKKANYIRYPFKYESGSYEKQSNEFVLTYDMNLKQERKQREIEAIKSAYAKLYENYLVEFISQGKFKWYLNRLESEIERINLQYWEI